MQERLYYEKLGLRRDADSPESGEALTQSREELREIDRNAQRKQQLEESPQPQFMRVYETRPITAMSESGDPREVVFSPNSATWKRVYIVDRPKPRREAFIEKPKPQPVIFRTGKRWQPPPEQPYVWPSVRKPINVDAGTESDSNYSTGRSVEGAEYKWQPVVYVPDYKHEHKNFTPENSPPGTPRGFGNSTTLLSLSNPNY
ncbi:unnamed protein product [Gongylonema pulchrum]|uniref:ZM domain-containing protein n=1 Tax=Gongylonema pulchrum TaxID=637853 RepID=A0A183EAQ7_9BILA|nr:unnamed protein product [Gongylonema pulchrum]